MQSMIHSSLIVLLLISLITGAIHNVCEICTCDNLDKPVTVHCDSKKLSSLADIAFNSSIETLTLINNSLTFKSDEDLQKLNNITSLKSLVLSNNPLATVPELSPSHLVNLQLENTYLKTATFPKSYENCTTLQSIVLDKNNVTMLTSDNFKSLPSSIIKLSINHAQLTSIEHDAFTSLSKSVQSISLASNSLQTAEFFPTLTHLLSINFDHNQFKQLPTEIMKPGRTKHFFFRDNQIETIDELSPLFYWTKANLSDIEIYLNNNPFDCCQSRWFIHYLMGANSLVKDASNLTCAVPHIYAGKRLIDLRVDLMDCSNEPFHPSNVHLSKLAIVISCLLGVVIFISFVVGATLYRRNRIYSRRRQEYEPVQGDLLSA